MLHFYVILSRSVGKLLIDTAHGQYQSDAVRGNGCMFQFYAPLMTGDTVVNTANMQAKLNAGEGISDLFLLCIDTTGSHMLEIFQSVQLFTPHFSLKNYLIIGMANGRKESKDVAVKLLQHHIKNGYKVEQFRHKFL